MCLGNYVRKYDKYIHNISHFKGVEMPYSSYGVLLWNIYQLSHCWQCSWALA